MQKCHHKERELISDSHDTWNEGEKPSVYCMGDLITGCQIQGPSINHANISYSNLVTVRNVVAARLCFHRRLWFCSGGGCVRGRGACMAGGMCGRGDVRGGEGACMAGEMATAADGTHPTGMHSSNEFHLNSISTGIWCIQTKIDLYPCWSLHICHSNL